MRTADGVDLAVYDFGNVSGGAGGGGAGGGAGGAGGAGAGVAGRGAGGASGGRARPPLLLAHATGFHGRTWLPVVEAGLGDRFHCFAFDERAHGDSSPPPDDDFSWLRFADDALAVLDHFNLLDTSPFAVGHSCGGALLLLAEMARPGTFRSIYCYEPVIMPSDELPDPSSAAQNPLAIGARRRREVFESHDAALANFASKPPMSGFAPESLRAYVEWGFEPVEPGGSDGGTAGDPGRASAAGVDVDMGAVGGAGNAGVAGGVRLKCRGEHEARTYEAALFHGAYRRLGEVHCPVTLVCGEHTNAFGEETLRLDAARLLSARVEVLPGLTHFGPLEDPAAVAASILRAFESQPGSATETTATA